MQTRSAPLVLLLALTIFGLGGGTATAQADEAVIAASSGNDSELIESIPIGKRSGHKPRVAMTIPPQRLGELRAGDRLEVNAEIEVSVCMKPNALHPGDGRPCIGRRYGYDPNFTAQAVLAPSGSELAPEATLPVSGVHALRCTQSQPDRNHHCVLVIPPTTVELDNATSLPCPASACHLNLVVGAHHRQAKGGNRLVLGSDEDNGSVNGDKGRLNVLRLRPNLLGIYPTPDELANSDPQLTRLPIAAKGGGTDKRVVASVPLDDIRVGDRLVVEGFAEGRIGHYPYNVFLNSHIALSTTPDGYERKGSVYGTTDLHGQVTKGNGFNCTLGSSAHPNPCQVRKAGVITFVKDPERTLYANLVIGAMAIGTAPQYERWRPGDAVKFREASVRVSRYRDVLSQQRFERASVPEGVEDLGPGHRDSERAQAVQDADRSLVGGEHAVEALVGVGRLIGAAAAELDPAGSELAADLAEVDPPRPHDLGLEELHRLRLRVLRAAELRAVGVDVVAVAHRAMPALAPADLAGGLAAAHHPPGAVDGRVQRALGALGPLEDHRLLAHRRADEGGRGRRASSPCGRPTGSRRRSPRARRRLWWLWTSSVASVPRIPSTASTTTSRPAYA